jgi:hypothetical protein
LIVDSKNKIAGKLGSQEAGRLEKKEGERLRSWEVEKKTGISSFSPLNSANTIN